jgi:FAD/FMN-containing dehydrogenase
MDILEINEEKKYVRCEPMVSIQRLFEALQAKGYDHIQYLSCSPDPRTNSESSTPDFF